MLDALASGLGGLLRRRWRRESRLPAAAEAMVAAAREGRDRVTPLRNRIGRAGWLGERTEGKVDPGCGFAVVVLAALAKG